MFGVNQVEMSPKSAQSTGMLLRIVKAIADSLLPATEAGAFEQIVRGLEGVMQQSVATLKICVITLASRIEVNDQPSALHTKHLWCFAL
jgi:hypothetical protein